MATSKKPTESESPVDLTNPFANLDALRVSANDADELGVKRALLRVPVRKPGPQDWFRVHPDPEYRMDTAIIELKDEREIYMVAPHMRGELLGETQLRRLYTAINRQGVVFLIPCGLPDIDGRSNPWHKSLIKACEHAMDRWVRCRANLNLGGYDTFEASGEIPDPEWPDKPFSELLQIAFQENYVETESHPVIRRLLGY